MKNLRLSFFIATLADSISGHSFLSLPFSMPYFKLLCFQPSNSMSILTQKWFPVQIFFPFLDHYLRHHQHFFTFFHRCFAVIPFDTFCFIRTTSAVWTSVISFYTDISSRRFTSSFICNCSSTFVPVICNDFWICFYVKKKHSLKALYLATFKATKNRPVQFETGCRYITNWVLYTKGAIQSNK